MRLLLCLLFIPLLSLAALLCNAVQMLSLVFLPFSLKAFRAVNRQVARSWFSAVAIFVENLPGLEFIQTGDSLPVKENVFVIANHQSGADIPVIIVLARRCRRTADLKWFVKDVIKWMPGIGWGMLFLDCLFLKRNWTADKEKVMATFERLRKHRVKFFLLSYVEGTRLTPAKLKRSQEYCRRAKLPVLSHVMSPRTRGFEATLEGLGAMTDAVYDVTIAFEDFPTGAAPGFLALFIGPVRHVHLHVRRYPASALPTSKEGRVQWILDRFTEKDQLLSEFYRSGRMG